MEQRELTCIGCPMGCQLTVTVAEGAARQVAGNACPRGEQYAREEVSRPVRMVTSTVPVRGGEIPRVSVKTAAAVVRSSLQVMLLRGRTAEEYRAGLEQAVRDNERVEVLISRMLLLARDSDLRGAAALLEERQPPQSPALR